jgi:hypothetical protein
MAWSIFEMTIGIQESVATGTGKKSSKRQWNINKKLYNH